MERLAFNSFGKIKSGFLFTTVERFVSEQSIQFARCARFSSCRNRSNPSRVTRKSFSKGMNSWNRVWPSTDIPPFGRLVMGTRVVFWGGTGFVTNAKHYELVISSFGLGEERATEFYSPLVYRPVSRL